LPAPDGDEKIIIIPSDVSDIINYFN